MNTFHRLLGLPAVLVGLTTMSVRAADYTWTDGASNLTWDTSSANWTLGSGNIAWVDGNAAVFGSGGVGAVTVSGTRSVTGLTVGADGYSLSGGQIDLGSASTTFAINNNITISSTIGGGTNALEKTGSGTLTLSGSNTYTGSTTVSAGTLRLGSAGGVGTGASGGVTVASGAVFDVNGFSIASTNKVVTISGNGSGAGALVNTGGSTGAVRRIDFSTAATVGGTGRLDVGFGATAISGGTNTLTKTGTNQFTINTGAVTVGNIDVQQGTLSVVNNSGGLGDTTYGTSVAGGAILAFYQNGATAMTVAENLTLADTAELRSSRAQLTTTLTGAISLTGGTVTVNSLVGVAGDSSTLVLTGDITGSGAINKTGTGILSLTGSNSYSGGTTVSAGTLSGNSTSLQGAITNNAALIFDQASTGTYAGTLGGTGTLEKTGSGNLTLSGPNTYSGATTVSQGTLTVGNASALGTTAGTTSVASGATVDLNGFNIGGETVQISGTGVGGNGALVNTSGSTATGLRLALSADATIGGSGRIDTAFNFTVINAGTHTLTKTGSGSFVINAGTTSMGTLLVNGGSVVAVNTGTAFGDTTYGTSIASGASVQFFNNTGSAIANSENFTLANGAEIAGTTATSQNTLNGSISLTSGSATVRVEASGVGTLEAAGVISGAGGINKTSGGTLVLSGDNTYTGDTTVTGGTLSLATSGELRFDIGANGINNALLGSGTALLDGTFRFDLTGAGTIVGNSWNVVDVGNLTETFGGSFDVLSTMGSFTNNSGVWSITENGVVYEFSQSTGLLTVVPEPSAGALGLAGLAVLAFRCRRRSPGRD